MPCCCFFSACFVSQCDEESSSWETPGTRTWGGEKPGPTDHKPNGFGNTADERGHKPGGRVQESKRYSGNVNRTARPIQTAPGTGGAIESKQLPGKPAQYAIGQVDFSDSQKGQTGGSVPTPQSSHGSASGASAESDGLREPSLVFVRSAQANSATPSPRSVSERPEDSAPTQDLPAGTRIVARLQSAVTARFGRPSLRPSIQLRKRRGNCRTGWGKGRLAASSRRTARATLQFISISRNARWNHCEDDATAMSLAYALMPVHL